MATANDLLLDVILAAAEVGPVREALARWGGGAWNVEPLPDRPGQSRLSGWLPRTVLARLLAAVPPAAPPADAPAAELLALHNSARGAHGLPPLVADPRLAAAALDHARAMAAGAGLTHSGWAQEIAREGYPSTWEAQNIGEGYPTAAAMFAAWMGDGPHAANVLNPTYTRAGFGLAVDAGGTAWWAADYAAAPPA